MLGARAIGDLVRTFGLRGLVRRGLYLAGRRSGYFERVLPVQPLKLGDTRVEVFPYRFELERIRQLYHELPAFEDVRAQVIEEAERLLGGKIRFFSREWVDVGWPPRWLQNPSTGASYDSRSHWCHIADLDPIKGDIKYVWEPSRFTFVYLLARAYLITGQSSYARAFWQAVESWAEHNPPNGGPNWRCGQEASLRSMSLLFGLLVFINDPETTSARLVLALALLRTSGRRVAATLGYALSQRNNHAISELVGLWTLSAFFPRWPQSPRWRRLSEQGLQEILADQFYPDGAYVQHSFNYQRLALHNLLWLLRVAELTGVRPPTGVERALDRSLDFLHALQDQHSGWLPNYGANDGALILPLSTANYRDYRPTLQALSLRLRGQRLYLPGVYDEEAIWLAPGFLPSAGPLASPPGPLRASVGGYYALRGTDSLAFFRAARYRHRPSQADNLHFDLWIGGLNLALDPGTYSYNKPAPWDNGLARTRVHNTATANGLDQMIRAGRFLWLEWSHAEVLAHHAKGEAELWLLQTRLVPPSLGQTLHRRGVFRRGDLYIVTDLLESRQERELRLHWNLAPLEWRVTEAPSSRTYESGDYQVRVRAFGDAYFWEKRGGSMEDPIGWHSPYYGVLEPCLAVEASVRGTRAAFCTVFGRTLERWEAEAEEELVAVLASPRQNIPSTVTGIVEKFGERR